MDRTVPKPICAPTPIYVKGTVRLDQTVVFTPSGNLISHFHVIGHVDVTPIDPVTGAQGETYRGLVNQHAKGIITDGTTLVSAFQIFAEIPKSKHDALVVSLKVGPHGAVSYTVDAACQ
jgi:hypothetical protein